MSRHASSLDRSYFETLYEADPDPWRFATSDYEREKYAASIAALPSRRYDNALEVGCSIGIFTRLLAALCQKLLALDVAEKALAQARKNCRLEQVTFANRRIPKDWPDGTFDLIVLSEVLYYLDTAELAQAAYRTKNCLRREGTVLLVHYLGETDYPLSGDDAANAFIESLMLPIISQRRTDSYRIDILVNQQGQRRLHAQK